MENNKEEKELRRTYRVAATTVTVVVVARVVGSRK